MKNIAIIPARGGSKRLPGKNILPLGGLPLIAHSILFAQRHPEIIDAVYVSTDDAQIKETALSFGALVMNRPASISGDLDTTVSALKHVVESLEFEIGNIIVLQPTNPLRPENLLKEAFEAYQTNHCDSLFTVSRNCHKLGTIANSRFQPFNYKIGQRSQDLEPLFFENGLLYICKSGLVSEGVLVSENVFPFETDHVFGNVDIDTQQDFEYAEYLYKKLITKNL